MDGLWWKILLKVDDLGLPLFLETPTLTHLTNGAWNKKMNLIFRTKHVIPKSSMFNRWPSQWMTPDDRHLGVSKNRDYPKSSISMGFSIIFTIHFGGKPPIFGNTNALMTPYIWRRGVSSPHQTFRWSNQASEPLPHIGEMRSPPLLRFRFLVGRSGKKNKSLHLQNGHNIKQFYNWGYSYSIYIIRFKTALSTCKLMFGHL